MNNIDLMNYWVNSSQNDYETMKLLFNNKKYTWSLFIGHLVIEKLLKGLYAKNNIESPYCIKTHNLLLLAEKCELNLSYCDIDKLKIISEFNIIRKI